MKFEFSAEKNSKLIAERKISFEEIITELEEKRIVAVGKNSNKYSGQ